ncbi:MAG TPA: hypothetical protein VNW29_04315 [Candidatus Sulfotelmatobacter sp.]|nr:hypothetical protein [Candidatus Sulfotelmatobacter sp.]
MQRSGYKTTHFAKKLGITPQHLWRLTRDKSVPSLALAFKIQTQSKGCVLVNDWRELALKGPEGLKPKEKPNKNLLDESYQNL